MTREIPEETPSPTLSAILAHNRRFVDTRGFEPYLSDKLPSRKLAVVACMDTRLVELLPQALGIRNGEAMLVKVAGGQIADPYGEAMRSLLIAVCELGVEEILVLAHTNCGAQHLSGEEMQARLSELGVGEERFSEVEAAGVDLEQWMRGFGDTSEAVRRSVRLVREHPLMPGRVSARGGVIDSATGELTLIC